MVHVEVLDDSEDVQKLEALRLQCADEIVLDDPSDE
jgi:hypothetical protein